MNSMFSLISIFILILICLVYATTGAKVKHFLEQVLPQA